MCHQHQESVAIAAAVHAMLRLHAKPLDTPIDHILVSMDYASPGGDDSNAC